MDKWGWTSYKRLGLELPNGAKGYVGRFRQDHDYRNWTTARVYFYARHPIKALKTICQSGNDPTSCAWEIVN